MFPFKANPAVKVKISFKVGEKKLDKYLTIPLGE